MDENAQEKTCVLRSPREMRLVHPARRRGGRRGDVRRHHGVLLRGRYGGPARGGDERPASRRREKAARAASRRPGSRRNPHRARTTAPPRPARAIAEEAFIYGFPLVVNYETLYDFNVDKASPQYKGPFNRVLSEARVFTPKDTTIVTPNSDTPYSMLQMDLRAEPLVLTVPEVEKGRYYSVQLIDMYTFNYGYIGSRATGNGAGTFLVAGPSWKGETPPGVKKAFRCETDFSHGDLPHAAFQPGRHGQREEDPGRLQGSNAIRVYEKARPAGAPTIVFDKIDKDLAKVNPFGYLSFVLQFCPPVEEEKALRAKFAEIGIVAGKPFDAAALPPMQMEGLLEGVKSGMEKIEHAAAAIGRDVNGWRVMTGTLDRAGYHGDWLAARGRRGGGRLCQRFRRGDVSHGPRRRRRGQARRRQGPLHARPSPPDSSRR